MEFQGSEVKGSKGGRWGPGGIKPKNRTGYVLFCTLLWSMITFLALHRFVLSTVVVEGLSMAPTLKPGNCLLVNCWLPFFREYHRGDIVVVRDRARGELMVKRIVGMPSDSVQVREGRVYINDQLLTENYLPFRTYTEPGRTAYRAYKVAKDAYFVLGDNRPISDDSRFYGAVKRSDLMGLIAW